MIVEHLASRWRIPLTTSGAVRVGTGCVGGTDVRLVEPLGFMNRSGDALRSLGSGWNLSDLIVVHDDIDLAFGQLRIRHDGGTGGHRGVASIVECFGRDFDRVRVGVGRPTAGVAPAEYVLAELDRDVRDAFGDVVARGSDALECLLTEGLERAMSRFNSRTGYGAAMAPRRPQTHE
jgi:PTH1 family peptidyl-tRNA hydrolase